MGSDIPWARSRLRFARAARVRYVSSHVRPTLFEDTRVQSGVRSAFGVGLVYFSAGHSEVRLSSIQVRSTVSHDPLVRYEVRSTLGHASLTFRTGTRRSDLFQARSDLLCSRIRRCNLGSDLRLGLRLVYFSTGRSEVRSSSGQVRSFLF